jgi:hypothetical protein
MSLDNSPINFAQPNDVTGRNSEPNNYMPGSEHAGLSPAIVESIAGLSAGTVATLVVHPLDIVKTRMQSKIWMCLCCVSSSLCPLFIERWTLHLVCLVVMLPAQPRQYMGKRTSSKDEQDRKQIAQ